MLLPQHLAEGEPSLPGAGATCRAIPCLKGFCLLGREEAHNVMPSFLHWVTLVIIERVYNQNTDADQTLGCELDK